MQRRKRIDRNKNVKRKLISSKIRRPQKRIKITQSSVGHARFITYRSDKNIFKLYDSVKYF